MEEENENEEEYGIEDDDEEEEEIIWVDWKRWPFFENVNTWLPIFIIIFILIY